MWPMRFSSGRCSVDGGAAKAGPLIARKRHNRVFRSDPIAALSPPADPCSMAPKAVRRQREQQLAATSVAKSRIMQEGALPRPAPAKL